MISDPRDTFAALEFAYARHRRECQGCKHVDALCPDGERIRTEMESVRDAANALVDWHVERDQGGVV